jgi:hypothetical protein
MMRTSARPEAEKLEEEHHTQFLLALHKLLFELCG